MYVTHSEVDPNLKVSNLRAATVNPKLERVTQLSAHGAYNLSLTELERVTQLSAHGVGQNMSKWFQTKC